MKTFIASFFLLALFPMNGNAQEILNITSKKFLSVHFPAEVIFHKVNAMFEKQLGVMTQGNTLFIQSFDSFDETNMIVKTSDGAFYSFVLQYKNDISILEKTILPEIKVINKEKVKKDTSHAQFKETANKIMSENGFIHHRNFQTKYGVSLLLKGMYFKGKNLFVYFMVSNETQINYLVDSFQFYITNDKSIASSAQLTNVDILATFTSTEDKVFFNEEKKVVFVLPKMTLSKKKMLIFEMLEKNGDRNLSFSINPSSINSARRL